MAIRASMIMVGKILLSPDFSVFVCVVGLGLLFCSEIPRDLPLLSFFFHPEMSNSPAESYVARKS
jgi:hypothetical protein